MLRYDCIHTEIKYLAKEQTCHIQGTYRELTVWALAFTVGR
jgi:hypothetical protein